MHVVRGMHVDTFGETLTYWHIHKQQLDNVQIIIKCFYMHMARIYNEQFVSRHYLYTHVHFIRVNAHAWIFEVCSTWSQNGRCISQFDFCYHISHYNTYSFDVEYNEQLDDVNERQHGTVIGPNPETQGTNLTISLNRYVLYDIF